MASTSTILPTLPKALIQAIQNPVAFAWKDIVQGLRVKGGLPVAEALDKAQQYIDSLNGTQQLLLGYIQATSAVPSPTPTVDTSGIISYA
jgi:hypothetical protein